MKHRKDRYTPPRERPARRKSPAVPKRIAEEDRDDEYAQVCRQAVKHGETDKLVRHLMAAGLADSPSSERSKVLAQDLNLLKWVLGKMTDNRRDAELRAIASED